MDTNLGKLRQRAEDRGAQGAAVLGSQRVRCNLAAKQQHFNFAPSTILCCLHG